MMGIGQREQEGEESAGGSGCEEGVGGELYEYVGVDGMEGRS